MTTGITLALPSKGMIADPTISFLHECGLKVDKPNQRQYTGLISTLPSIAILFQRVTDVLYKVADGTAQIGITGLDVVNEHLNSEVVIIHDRLGYGHCNLVVAIPESWVDVDDMIDLSEVATDFREIKRRNIRIATKYPSLARRFLHTKNIHHFTLVKAEGAIEAAPNLGYADFIIDLTQTGTTLRENHLKTLPDGIILESQACLIGNRSALRNSPSKLSLVRTLIEYIDSAQLGRGYYQLTANVQGENAESIAESFAGNSITRGLQGPTVSPILGTYAEGQDHWYTVAIIIPIKDLLAATEYIRSIGGTQIIVSQVRYIFLKESPTFRRLLGML
jgi:ATP phosphoribosyltransferase